MPKQPIRRKSQNSKRPAIIALCAIAALGAAHTAFWFYRSGAIQKSIAAVAGQVSSELGKNNSEFFYTSSSVSGYPLNFKISISEPRFINSDGARKTEISSGQENLLVTSNLWGSGYKVKLPAKLDIKSQDEAGEKNYHLEFAGTGAELYAAFSGNMFSAVQGSEAAGYLDNNLKKLQYQDSGYTLSNAADGASLASSGPEKFNLARSKSKHSITSEITGQWQDTNHSALIAMNEPQAASAAIWPVSGKIDISIADERDENGKSSKVDINVKQADLDSALFSLAVKGNVKASGDDIFPYGDLSIKISNYSNMVDYTGAVLGDAFAESKFPLFHIKRDKTPDFKRVLYQVASEKSNNDQDILLTFSREQGKNLFIGQKGLMEVIALLKEGGAADEAPATQNTNEKIDSGKSILDAEPAAGGEVAE